MFYHLDHDEFMSRYNGKNENNFTGEDLSMFLTFKEFPPELINFVENLFQIKEIRCNLFHWNKNELRVYMCLLLIKKSIDNFFSFIFK